MLRRRVLSTAVIGVTALVAASCTTVPEESAPTIPALVVGTFLPEEGELGTAVRPFIRAVELAVHKINIGGGVVGQPVQLNENIETKAEPKAALKALQAIPTDDRPTALVGPALSTVAEQVIPWISENDVVTCSAVSTAARLSQVPDDGYFFRTALPDTLAAKALTAQLNKDGFESALVIARDDTWGHGYVQALRDDGLQIKSVFYKPGTTDFAATTKDIQPADNQALVLVAIPGEVEPLYASLFSKGVKGNQVFFGSGLDVDATQVVPGNPAALDGVQAVRPRSTPDPGFAAEFEAFDSGQVASLSSETGGAFDCVNIVALSAQIAGSTSAAAIRGSLGEVVSGDEVCRSFEVCVALLDDGKSIQYVGASGVITLDSHGDRSSGEYELVKYSGPNPDPALQGTVVVTPKGVESF